MADHLLVLQDISTERLPALYRSCDLFAMLPRVDHGFFEGFGLVYLEAGACGKPVIGSRSGGVPDAVIDGETGFLVPEEDPNSAAGKIVEILTNSRLAAALGRRGREWAHAHSWDSYAESLVALYRSVIGQVAVRRE